jgi:hypothetical protein
MEQYSLYFSTTDGYYGPVQFAPKFTSRTEATHWVIANLQHYENLAGIDLIHTTCEQSTNYCECLP